MMLRFFLFVSILYVCLILCDSMCMIDCVCSFARFFVCVCVHFVVFEI